MSNYNFELKMKKILFLFLFLFVISSCRDNEEDILSPNNREYTPKIITETYGSAKLVGYVKDKNGTPLSGVTVFFGEEKTLTGSDGAYQLNTLSAGFNKRIWFQKSGYASTQKLADIKVDLPNRIDASLFKIDKTGKMNNEGGKIEGKDFSLEIKPGGFVYSDGSPVKEEVIVEVTAFLTIEDEFLDAFPGEFRGTRVDGSVTAIESFGFIDVVLKVATGEPVQLADGVKAIIKIKAPEKAPATIPMWHYNEDKAKWIEEGVGILDNGFYTAEVSHFTKWNCDRPYGETSKIVGRVIDYSGNPIEGASVVQKGITYRFQNSTKSNEKGEFELPTPESNESNVEAQFEFYGSTIINYITSPNKGQTNYIGDIKINVSIDNIMPPLISNNVLYISIGQTAKIRGNYFGKEKKQGYKLLLNGNEVETKTWKNDLIEFEVPNGIPEEGIMQIDRGGLLSREVNYKEGDWACEIGGIAYNNNDLPIEDGKYQINLFNSNLLNIPNCIGNLQNLQELALATNKFTSLPESFANLKNLQKLFLAQNELNSLPESFGNLQNLQKLNLVQNKLNSLPERFGNLQNLDSVELAVNQLITLPESFGNLQNLKMLRLDENQLTTLPESFGNLQNLEVLWLKHNQLTTLPESFSNLQNLEFLNLDENQLTSLPESFSNLKKLRNLVLDNNQLITLPESIGNLKILSIIKLNANQLVILPESIGNLKNLTELQVHENQLTTLPENIGNLQNLQVLNLYENQLTILPESICNLQNLSDLILYGNRLTTLPENIGNLRNLNRIFLSDNQLTSLPESIGNLKKIKWVDLRNNKLTSLPESIKNLKDNLNNLFLEGNNFSEKEKAKIKGWLPNTEINW